MGKMLSRRQMQHLCICLALGLLLCSLWQAAAWGRTQLHTGDAVCADTLRLHIRAASDAVADQSAKLRVRDAVLTCLDAACPAGNQTDARSWAARNLFTLQLAARHALARCGVNAPVQVQLVNMYFPARQYTGGCLPAAGADGDAHRIVPSGGQAAGRTGGACCTPGCAVPPAAAMPCRKKTIWSAASISCGSGWWTGGTGTLLPAPPGCWPGDAALPCRIAWRERSV